MIAPTALTNPTLGQIALIAQRRDLCPAQVFLKTVQRSVMGYQLVQMLGTSCSPLVRCMVPTVARRMIFFGAWTDPAVFIEVVLAILKRIVLTGRMRVLSSAKTSVRITRVRISTSAIMAVVFGCRQSVLLVISPFVKMAQTWTSPSAKASVTLTTLIKRIHTACHVDMAPRSAFSAQQSAMATLTVTMVLGLKSPGMNRIVLFLPRLV